MLAKAQEKSNAHGALIKWIHADCTNFAILSRPPNSRHFLTKYTNATGEEVLVEESNFYDEISQVNHIQWFHIVAGQTRKTDLLEIRQFFPQGMKALLQRRPSNLKPKL